MPPGTWRNGVRYRPRPTSQVRDYGRTLAEATINDPGVFGTTSDPRTTQIVSGGYDLNPPPKPTPTLDRFGLDRDRLRADLGNLNNLPSRDPLKNMPRDQLWFDPYAVDGQFGSSVGDAWGAWQRALAAGQGGVDQAAIGREQAQQELDLQEQALRQAMLDGDRERAQAALDGIKRARAYINQSYQDYNTLVTPHYNQAIAATSQIYEDNAPALNKIAADEQAGIAGWFEEGRFDVEAVGKTIGADEVAQKAAMDKVGALNGLYVADAQGRAVSADSILQALETYSHESAKAFKMDDEYQMRNDRRIEDAVYGNREEGAQQAISDLDYRQKLFDIDKQRTKMAHDEALRRLNETGEAPYMDSVGFGQLTAETQLFDAMTRANIPLDRQQVIRSVLDDAWSAGVFDVEQFRAWMSETTKIDGRDVTRSESIGYPPLSPAEIKMLSRAMGAYGAGRNQYDSLAATSAENKGGGTTYGVNRGGEAPNNKANAAAARRGEGEYGARARRVASLIPEIEQQFDVSFLGQWRDLNAAVTADRSSNSDHYSGGALDFSGSDAEMKRLASWLSTRSDVSFVKVHGSPPHVHVSFRL